MPPTPISAPLLSFKASVFPIPVFPAFFHQPVTIGAILMFIPLVPIAAVVIVITVMIFRQTDHWSKK
jgi:hypothetical protein